MNALYSALILNSGIAHSATPTTLTISGSLSIRTLHWNDNTCPTNLTFSLEGVGTDNFPFIQNQESGFHIYRKQVSTTDWDGTLTGFTLIKSVNPNITATSDNNVLSPGMYRYVVVAYNNSGISIPQATNIVTCNTNFTPTNEYLSNVLIDINRAVSVTGAITTENIEIKEQIKAEFCAGVAIVFKPGLKVTGGAQLHAQIDNCIACSMQQQTSSNSTDNLSVFYDNTNKSIPIKGISNLKLPIQMELPSTSTNDIISIIPNPATDEIQILGNVVADVEFFSSIGLSVLRVEKGVHKVDVSQLSSGIYYARIPTATGEVVKSFMIIR